MSLGILKTWTRLVLVCLLFCAIDTVFCNIDVPPPSVHNGKEEIEVYLKKHKTGPERGTTSALNHKRALWELSGLYEGDILLPETESRNAITGDAYRWKDGVIPFYINPAYSKHDADQILAAFDQITSRTCVRFREWKKGDMNWIFVTNETLGCWAYVGKQLVGGQNVNLGTGCAITFIAVHETLHALGFWHQQNSYDRDEYITIIRENIKDGQDMHFEKHPHSSSTDFGVSYDYGSIMHYDADAFSKNGKPTMVAKGSNIKIGGATRMTDKDVEKIKRMYHCDGKGVTSEHEGGWKNKGSRCSNVGVSHRLLVFLQKPERGLMSQQIFRLLVCRQPKAGPDSLPQP